MRYAKGKHALGRCARCGDKAPYLELVADGQIPGLRVHPDCRDTKHPTEKPFRAEDAIGLKKPAPDLDDDATGTDPTTLADVLGGNNFGGGT